jgi:hypothetical protein
MCDEERGIQSNDELPAPYHCPMVQLEVERSPESWGEVTLASNP